MTIDEITVTPEDVPPDAAEFAPGVPAEDPQPPTRSWVVPPFAAMFAGIYPTVLTALTGTSKARGSALKPYELKAADIALTLTQHAIAVQASA